MKKIVLITDFTPTVDNINGPSALCYYIFKALQNEYDVHIYSTNANKVNGTMLEQSKETFGENIQIIPRNLWMKILLWKKSAPLFRFFYPSDLPTLGRYRLPNRVVQEIHKLNPDLVVFYPMTMLGPLKQLKKFNSLVIGPDCFSLHYIRALSNPYYYQKGKMTYALDCIMKNVFLATTVAKIANTVALVGREDCALFNTITNSRKAMFLPHPHYSLVDKEINLNKERLKVIITGNYNEYTDVDVDIMITHLVNSASDLKMYDFTFLGKSWGSIVDKLKTYLNVEHKIWVDDYVEELKNYDIQIFPICLGSGTKGKVLDAASTGLLCIGSYIAFENISLVPKVSCLLYKKASEIPEILEKVFKMREKHQEIAIKGRELVRKYHNVAFAVDQINGMLNESKSTVDESKYLFYE